MALPGWYSLSSVVEIHAKLEAIAIVFFVALVVFDVCAHLNKKREQLLERLGLFCFAVAVLAEVCAYPYSRRVDILSADANAKLNKEANKARNDASEANVRSKALEVSNKQLGIDLEAEKQKTAKSQKETADAQLALKNGLASVARRQLPRGLIATTFVRTLSHSPKAKAAIWYRLGDPESFLLASEIFYALGSGARGSPGAGWEVSSPVPMPEPSSGDVPYNKTLSFCFGVCVASRNIVEPPGPFLGTPFSALVAALGTSISGTAIGGITSSEMPSLPANTFIVVVGFKL